MSRWGDGPWDNDNAADWKEKVLGAADFRACWLRELGQDAGQNWEIIRAAIFVFAQRDDWPEHFRAQDLQLAVGKLREVVELPHVVAASELGECIRQELAALDARTRVAQ